MINNLYLQMVLIRTLEAELQKLCDSGRVSADLHFSTGQEAISVGVVAALRKTDYVVTHHRTIAHAVARGVPLEPLVAEVLGRPSGWSSGRAGEMHLSYPLARLMFAFQLVGTCLPVAAGLAWAVKNVLKTNDIVCVFHGDAATSNGQWHEGMNLAAVQGLPLLVVCENNGLAGNVQSQDYQPVLNVEDRVAGYGVRHIKIDGNEVELVRTVAANLAAWVRQEQRPVFVECNTVRLGKHKQGQGDLRTREQLAELWALDPIPKEAISLHLSPGEVRVHQRLTFNRVQQVLDAVLA